MELFEGDGGGAVGIKAHDQCVQLVALIMPVMITIQLVEHKFILDLVNLSTAVGIKEVKGNSSGIVAIIAMLFVDDSVSEMLEHATDGSLELRVLIFQKHSPAVLEEFGGYAVVFSGLRFVKSEFSEFLSTDRRAVRKLVHKVVSIACSSAPYSRPSVTVLEGDITVAYGTFEIFRAALGREIDDDAIFICDPSGQDVVRGDSIIITLALSQAHVAVHLVKEGDGAVTQGMVRVSVVADIIATSVELSRVVHLFDLLSRGSASLRIFKNVEDLVDEVHCFRRQRVSQARHELLYV